MGRSGSTAVVAVVPRVEAAKAGASPARRSAAAACSKSSGRAANASSVSMARKWPNPAIRAPFSTDEWAWAEA